MSDQPRGLRSLFGDSLVYGISVAAAPLALVLATPVLARELGPSGYGIVDVLAALLSLASIVAMVGLDSAAARTWFDEPDAARRLASLRTALALVFGVSCVVAVLLVLTGVVVAEVGGSRVGTAAVVAAFGLLPLANAQLVARLGFLLPRRRAAYLTAGLLQAAVASVAAVALVVAGAGTVGVLRRARRRSSGVSRLLARGKRPASRPQRGTRPRLPDAPLRPAARPSRGRSLARLRRRPHADRRVPRPRGGRLLRLASKVTAPMLLLVSAFGIAWPPFIFGQPSERRLALRARALTAVLAGAWGSSCSSSSSPTSSWACSGAAFRPSRGGGSGHRDRLARMGSRDGAANRVRGSSAGPA